MRDLSNQKKGSLMAFVAVMLITPDSLFIRLSSIDTWGLVFYRGIIPFGVVFIAMIIIYQTRFFKTLFIKTVLIIADLFLNQVFIEKILRIFKL